MPELTTDQTITLTLTPHQQIVLRYLLDDVVSGRGDPLKDVDQNGDITAHEAYEAGAALARALWGQS